MDGGATRGQTTGASPTNVVRCMMRRSRPKSNAVRACIVGRLSHIRTSCRRQRWVNTQPAVYQRIQVRPLADALGAEVSGIDLAAPLDSQTERATYRLHSLLVDPSPEAVDIA